MLHGSTSYITRCSALFSMSCIAKYAPSGAYLFELYLSAKKNAVNKIGTIPFQSKIRQSRESMEKSKDFQGSKKQ